MKFFVDTADVDAIRELNELGLVDGVTTNPSLIAKSGRDILEVTKEICDMIDGPVSAEVVATEYEAMVEEGFKLAEIAPNIAIKVPLTLDGMIAIFRTTLEREGTEAGMAYLNQLLEVNPEDPDYRFLKAGMLVIDGQDEEAERMYRALLEENPENVRVWTSLYRMKLLRDQDEEALSP